MDHEESVRSGTSTTSRGRAAWSRLKRRHAFWSNTVARSAEPGESIAGVSVHHLAGLFLTRVRDAGLSPEATIYELEERVIRGCSSVRCLRDGRPGSAYVDTLAHEDDAGSANYMLSYTWGYRIGDIVAALKHFCESQSLRPERTYIWICCLCINQHRVKEIEAAGTTVPFEQFQHTFAERVNRIGHVLALMTPWNNPGYLSRVWCVFEMFMALSNPENCSLQIIMTPCDGKCFSHEIAEKYGALDKVWRMLCALRVETAQASVELDKIRILKLIEEGPGYTEFDAQTRQRLQAWFAETVLHGASMRLSQGDVSSDSLRLYKECAKLAKYTGRVSDAIAHLEQASVLAKSTPAAATSAAFAELSIELSASYTNVNRNNDAIRVHQETRAMLESTGQTRTLAFAKLLRNQIYVMLSGGEGASVLDTEESLLKALELFDDMGARNSQETAEIHLHLAFVRRRKGRSLEALAGLEKSMEIRERLHTLLSPDGAMLLWSLGMLRYDTGDFQSMVASFDEAHRIRMMTGTEKTPQANQIYYYAGLCYTELGEVAKATETLDRARRASACDHRAFAPEHLDGALALRRGDAHRAAEQLRAAKRSLPAGNRLDLSRILMHLGSAELGLGNLPAATAAFAEAGGLLEDFEPGVGLWLEQLRLTAGLHRRRGDVMSAVRALESAAKVWENRDLLDSALGARVLAELASDRAEQALYGANTFRKEELAQAKRDLDRAEAALRSRAPALHAGGFGACLLEACAALQMAQGDLEGGAATLARAEQRQQAAGIARSLRATLLRERLSRASAASEAEVPMVPVSTEQSCALASCVRRACCFRTFSESVVLATELRDRR